MKKNELQDKAVALKYNEGEDRAPRIIAKGEGHIAAQIMETAKKNGIPLFQDNDLIELLSQIEIDREIPPELYTAIAEILSWVYRANNEIGIEHR